MTEEKYVKPGAQERALRKRAKQAKVAASKLSPMAEVLERRKVRARKAAALASQMLPDGITPKLRASIMAAHRRRENDPATQAMVARAKLTKRVQMAKEHAGISKLGEPPRFLGMDNVELEREVANSLPPSMSEIRAGKGKVDAKRKP